MTHTVYPPNRVTSGSLSRGLTLLDVEQDFEQPYNYQLSALSSSNIASTMPYLFTNAHPQENVPATILEPEKRCTLCNLSLYEV
jgi:hypothetical protein